MSTELRAIRVALPAEQIRRMDELIMSGSGGFESRGEFIREAVESQIVELAYPAAPESLLTLGISSQAELSESGDSAASDFGLAAGPQVHAVAPTLSDTSILSVQNGFQWTDSHVEPEGGPLFGLHNRDYPSLWALSRIAVLTTSGPIDFETCLEEVTRSGWEFGEVLLRLGDSLGSRVDTLFPTNREKPQSVAGRFQQFAVGFVTKRGGELHSGGPLFKWGCCALRKAERGWQIALTPAGHDLLHGMAGLTVAEPHADEFARRFVAHLQQYSPEDWEGFQTALAAIRDGAGRMDLVDAFATARPDWKENVVHTNASGYVARCREWGLVERKLANSQYVITRLGLDLSEGGL